MDHLQKPQTPSSTKIIQFTGVPNKLDRMCVVNSCRLFLSRPDTGAFKPDCSVNMNETRSPVKTGPERKVTFPAELMQRELKKPPGPFTLWGITAEEEMLMWEISFNK